MSTARKPPSRPKPMTAQSAASAIVQAIRSGDTLDEAIIARFDTTWRAAWNAAFEGEPGLMRWVRAEEGRLADDPNAFAVIRDALERALGEPRPTIPMPVREIPPRRMRVLGANELHNKDFRVEWLIKRVLVADQVCVVAAPKKSLKTSVMIDLAVSLATATPLLGYFEVPKPRKVLFLSGEAGGFEVRDRIDRVCRSRSCTLPDLDGNLFVCLEDLPRITEAGDLAELGEIIAETGAEVVILDPLYLCLMSGNRPVDAANLMMMGPVLAALNRACREQGASLILVHHMRKNSGGADRSAEAGGDASQPELEDIAYAGVQEFARQWIMLKRRRRYEPGTGQHHLWMSAGGSAISGGCWQVDIAEGVQADDFSGQYWAPTVLPEAEAIANEQANRSAAKRDRETQADLDQIRLARKYEDQIIETLQRLGSKPKTDIIYNSKLNGDNARGAISRLLADRRIVAIPGPRRSEILSLAGSTEASI